MTHHVIFIRASLLAAVVICSACAGPGTAPRDYQPQAGQGQYQYPDSLRPEPLTVTPRTDTCGARLYQSLVGQNIGGVHIAVIAGDKRIIQPADTGDAVSDFIPDMQEGAPFVDVTDLLAGQPLYAPTIRTGVYRGQLGPERADRLTLELDEDGYIQRVECR
ncbi:hypothetical protein [Robiginitomaculum antarcticum]|uniref:hypothetical protein n=1 Tax=Robiginitomaculum antarcticum TaxID=437507 RepID=UPI000381A205|nr:hypothetical protein [Robiginitomaculum antarcticum]